LCATTPEQTLNTPARKCRNIRRFSFSNSLQNPKPLSSSTVSLTPPPPQSSGSDKHIRVEFAKSNSKPPKHARLWYSAAPVADAYTSVGMKRPALDTSAYGQYCTLSFAQ
jgi:hypothetical protein